MRILIAEDDPFSLNILRLMLESEHCHEIVAAKDGAAAWAELDKGAGFDLCILDIMMPEIDGLKLTARLRADPRFHGQRIMLCTALNERSIINQAAALGISHYIVKPYVKEHILKQVRRIGEECAAADHVEALSQVAARLGVGEAPLTTFRRDLCGEVDALAVRLRQDPSATGAAMRANALKGAAINLGARALAAHLLALEESLPPHSGRPLGDALAAVEAEVRLLARVVGAGAEAAAPA